MFQIGAEYVEIVGDGDEEGVMAVMRLDLGIADAFVAIEQGLDDLA